jgi:NFU1 iron-sulfur cluster scaffold homolog, mitochondrial
MAYTQEKADKLISVYAEASPNPESMKFVVNVGLLPEGTSVDYANVEAAKGSPFALELFQLGYVSRVFIASNFATVTKNTTRTWTELIPQIRAVVKRFLESEQPIFTENPLQERIEQAAAPTGSAEDQAISQKVIELLDNYVRPAVEQDGGNITFKSYNEGIVTVMLQGSCSGCPSSTITLKSGIENLLKRMVPEVKEVVAEGITV